MECSEGERAVEPVLLGIAAGLLSLPATGWPGFIVVAGALAAGWLMPEAPMGAALLYLAPALLLAGLRLMMSDDIDVGLVELTLLAVSTMSFIAIFTHVGPGLALRRTNGG